MRKHLIPALIAIVTLGSCGSDSNTGSVQELAGTAVPASSVSAPSPAPAPAASSIPLNLNGLKSLGQGPLNPEHGKPGHRCDIAVGAPLNTPAASTPIAGGNTVQPLSLPEVNTTPVAAPANGLNPEHGKPGHRCDIAVGAPLNSKPNTSVTTPITPAAAPVATVKPGMNPQHGQPGHRCDIAVGAPLNSKPQQPAVPAAPAEPAKADTSGI